MGYHPSTAAMVGSEDKITISIFACIERYKARIHMQFSIDLAV